ncbi:MAG TPA: hypothetical protein VKU61_10415 [Candidatus Binatia bacterium]|nr:hypothetical protein [Candidatus Binatia bacterium]
MRLIVAICVVLGACVRPAPGPPPDISHTVAVLAPTNETGDPLLVAGASFLEKYALATDRVTVPDVLASEAKLQLARRGFTVVSNEEMRNGGGLALALDVRRWEPDAPTQPAFVLVGIAASLVDPVTGRVVWSVERRTSPVATPGEVALGPAYVTAARKVIEELLAPLGPERPS